MATVLTMDRTLYSQKWGWRVFKDKKLFYRASPGTDLADCKRVSHFEALTKKGGDWEIIFETAKKTDVYRRTETGWEFIETKYK